MKPHGIILITHQRPPKTAYSARSASHPETRYGRLFAMGNLSIAIRPFLFVPLPRLSASALIRTLP